MASLPASKPVGRGGGQVWICLWICFYRLRFRYIGAMTSREDCLARDREDPLAALRDEFLLPADTIYLDGNSLGALPKASVARAQQAVSHEWGSGLINSWNDAGWYDMPRRIGDRLAKLIGAGAGEVVVTDSISVNLFKLLSAALHYLREREPQRTVIVSERGNFPADLYVAGGLIELLGGAYSLRLIDSPGELAAAITPDVAVVMLTQVDYRTGYLHDIQAVTARVKTAGAMMIWDLAHSAGALPVELNASGADGAVGCTYKYLNGGPGAPGFVWVPARNQESFHPPIHGWWSHRAPFAMNPEFAAADGIARFLCGTPPIVSLSLVDSALAIFDRTDMRALRAKSVALTELFIGLVDERCDGLGIGLASPRDSRQRGSQVSLTHDYAYAVKQALIGHKVIGDFREPNILRLGFTPLYVRYIDVWDTVETLVKVLASEEWKQPAHRRRQAVT
jgi:kynureninase